MLLLFCFSRKNRREAWDIYRQSAESKECSAPTGSGRRTIGGWHQHLQRPTRKSAALALHSASTPLSRQPRGWNRLSPSRLSTAMAVLAQRCTDTILHWGRHLQAKGRKKNLHPRSPSFSPLLPLLLPSLPLHLKHTGPPLQLKDPIQLTLSRQNGLSSCPRPWCHQQSPRGLGYPRLYLHLQNPSCSSLHLSDGFR